MNKLKDYACNWYNTYYKYSTNQLYIQFHITRLCECRCPHCYFNDLQGDKTSLSLIKCKDIINQVVDSADKLSLKPLIDFTGGDPLLHPEIFEILSYASKKGVSIGLKCNSHQIDLSTIQKLRNYNVERIYLSLEGLEQINDKIRGIGDFNRTIKAISLLKENGFYVRVHMTISQVNMNQVIPLMQFFIDNKFIIDVFSWSRFWSDSKDKLLISSKELYQVLKEQLTYLDKIYNSDEFYTKLLNGNVVPRIGFEFKEHIWFPFLCKMNYIDKSTEEKFNATENSINCTSTRNVYIIDNNGDIAKCRKIKESIIGNLFENNLYNLINNDINLRYKNLKLISKCGKCRYFNSCAGCPSIALAKTGCRTAKDPDCFIYSMKKL